MALNCFCTEPCCHFLPCSLWMSTQESGRRKDFSIRTIYLKMLITKVQSHARHLDERLNDTAEKVAVLAQVRGDTRSLL